MLQAWEAVLAAREGTLDVLSGASGFLKKEELAEFEQMRDTMDSGEVTALQRQKEEQEANDQIGTIAEVDEDGDESDEEVSDSDSDSGGGVDEGGVDVFGNPVQTKAERTSLQEAEGARRLRQEAFDDLKQAGLGASAANPCSCAHQINRSLGFHLHVRCKCHDFGRQDQLPCLCLTLAASHHAGDAAVAANATALAAAAAEPDFGVAGSDASPAGTVRHTPLLPCLQ